MIDFFSNRELAIIFWLLTFLIVVSTKKDVRKSSKGLIKAFFQTRIITVNLLMIIYTELLVFGLLKIGFWETSLLKETIYWPMFVGFPLIMKITTIGSEKNYLKTIAKDSFKGVVIIEFIANIYSFSLLVELIIIPVVTLVGISKEFTKDKPKYKAVEKLFTRITFIFGLTVLVYTGYKIYLGFSEFANLLTVKSFVLPIILTLLFLPFLYMVALWSLYEIMLMRTGHQLKEKKDKRYLKWQMFKRFLFNRKKLRKFQQTLGFERILNRKDIDNAFGKFGR